MTTISRRTLIGWAACGAVALLPALSWGQVVLERKLPEGTKRSFSHELEVSQKTNQLGMEFTTGSRQTRTFETTIGRRGADGLLPVESRIAKLQATVSLPFGVELTFDSDKPDAPRPGTQFDGLLDLFKATVGVAWTEQYDQQNNIHGLKLNAHSFDALAPEMKALVKGQLDETYLLDARRRELAHLPSRAIAVGDTWTSRDTVRLEAGQELTLDGAFKYDGVIEEHGRRLDKISHQVTGMSLAIADGSPIKLVDSDLAVKASEGAIYFDRAAGHVARSSSLVNAAGKITVEVGGQRIETQVDFTISDKVAEKPSGA